MKLPHRGEVWLVDLGLAAKIRPCLVAGAPAAGDDRVIVTLVPHTTSLRGTQYEVSVPVPFLRAGLRLKTGDQALKETRTIFWREL